MPSHLRAIAGTVLAILAVAAADASGQRASENDYAKNETWLCRPGAQDACAVDLTTTIVAADGTLTREAFTPNVNPAIDCFYVYPTVSLDPGGNSDMTPGPEERNVIRAQFARFGELRPDVLEGMKGHMRRKARAQR